VSPLLFFYLEALGERRVPFAEDDANFRESLHCLMREALAPSNADVACSLRQAPSQPKHARGQRGRTGRQLIDVTLPDGDG